MVDTGDKISIRNKTGFEVLALPATDEFRDFYGDNIMTRDEYLIKGGKFLDVRRNVFNLNTFYKEIYDSETGRTVERQPMEHLEDDIYNNTTLSVSELIDLTKTLSGDSIVDIPTEVKDNLSYYDMETGELISGSPAHVLGGALKSVGFSEDQIDKLFEGTVLEDPEKKEARIRQLEDEDELATDKNLDVIYLDAVTVNGELDFDHAEEMKPADVSEMLISKYESLVKGYLDGDERMGQFTTMLADYFKDTNEEEQAKKIATLVSIFNAADNGSIERENRLLGRKIDRLWASNGVQYIKGKGTKFDQFDKKIEERLEQKYDEWADQDERLTRLNNSFEEASAYADDCIAKGKIGPTSYEMTVQMKEKEISEACGNITEEDLDKTQAELDKLEKDRRVMQDCKFLSFIAEDVQVEITRRQNAEIASINEAWMDMTDEELSESVGALNEISGVVESKSDGVKISAASISASMFYGDDEEEVVSSDELEKIQLKDPEVEEDEDADIKIYNIYNKEDLGFDF